MKIKDLTEKNEYSARNIAKKQKLMAQNLQTRWAKDKKALSQQNRLISVSDYVSRVLPVINKVAPDIGKNIPVNASLRDENNFIAQALDVALKATNYWQRQIEKKAGMEPSGYNEPMPTATRTATTTPTAFTGTSGKVTAKMQPQSTGKVTINTEPKATANIQPQQRPQKMDTTLSTTGQVNISPPLKTSGKATATLGNKPQQPAAKPKLEPLTVNGEVINPSDPRYEPLAKKAGIIK